MKLKILREFKLTNTPTVIGAIDYRQLDSNTTTYSYNAQGRNLTCGKGEVVEDTINDYWEQYLKNTFFRNPVKKGWWDFDFNGKKVELRRMGRTSFYLGYGNAVDRKERHWTEKAEKLAESNGGYMVVVCRFPILHLVWFPAKSIMQKHKRRDGGWAGMNCSGFQAMRYWGIDMFLPEKVVDIIQ
jgi:hypothetical protein